LPCPILAIDIQTPVCMSQSPHAYSQVEAFGGIWLKMIVLKAKATIMSAPDIADSRTAVHAPGASGTLHLVDKCAVG
jgi:hypothetical protein